MALLMNNRWKVNLSMFCHLIKLPPLQYVVCILHACAADRQVSSFSMACQPISAQVPVRVRLVWNKHVIYYHLLPLGAKSCTPARTHKERNPSENVFEHSSGISGVLYIAPHLGGAKNYADLFLSFLKMWTTKPAESEKTLSPRKQYDCFNKSWWHACSHLWGRLREPSAHLPRASANEF